MSASENNPNLEELKRKWAKMPIESTSGVYNVEEALAEASAHLSIYNRRQSAPVVGDSSNDAISRELERRRKIGE